MNVKQLLVVAYAPSLNTQRMLSALLQGAMDADTENVTVKSLPPNAVSAEDIMLADALVLGTTENLGYMNGMTKDLFDRIYYPCLEKTQGLPTAVYIRAGHDGTATHKALESIMTGLKWRWSRPVLLCRGTWDDAFLPQCRELGETMAVALDCGIV